jgi:hypothetical protein
MLDKLSDLVGKVEKRARNPWIAQEMIGKMDERRMLTLKKTGKSTGNGGMY